MAPEPPLMADHQAQVVKPRSSISGVSVLVRVILVLLLFKFNITVSSQSIVKTLPGFSGDLPVKMLTGYVGVGERDDVQLFYYFIESERDPKGDPLMLWLTGGPGCTALRAFFYEIGPFTFDYSNFSGDEPPLEHNPYSWTKVANIIFIDQPVGTGFSYANTPEAYITSDTISAMRTYNFIRKWLVDHPKFLKNPLYITGISYMGMVVPIIVQEIYNDKKRDVNSRVQYAHRMALLSNELYKSTKEDCHGEYIDVDPNNLLFVEDLQEVDKCTEKINNKQILEPVCLTTNTKSNLLRCDRNFLEENPMNFLSSLSQRLGTWCRDYIYNYATIWATNKAVQKALHTREGTITEWLQCNQSLQYSAGKTSTVAYTFNVSSTVGYHRNLTNKNCQALILSGDHDLVVPHLATEKWIRFLNLSVESRWKPWFVEGQVAGYTVAYTHNDYSLTYATLKGAGQTPPKYKPKECLAMIDQWFEKSSL